MLLSINDGNIDINSVFNLAWIAEPRVCIVTGNSYDILDGIVRFRVCIITVISEDILAGKVRSRICIITGI